jgi:hypothetical protein
MSTRHVTQPNKSLTDSCRGTECGQGKEGDSDKGEELHVGRWEGE